MKPICSYLSDAVVVFEMEWAGEKDAGCPSDANARSVLSGFVDDICLPLLEQFAKNECPCLSKFERHVSAVQKTLQQTESSPSSAPQSAWKAGDFFLIQIKRACCTPAV